MFSKSLSGGLKQALVLACVAASGCAAIQPATPEQLVRQRSNEFWSARVAGQVEKAYALLTPAYRETHTVSQYKGRLGASVALKKGEVVNVTCEAVKCVSRVKLLATPLLPIRIGDLETFRDETWLLVDGVWWLHEDV
jgi:hypothetical protein